MWQYFVLEGWRVAFQSSALDWMVVYKWKQIIWVEREFILFIL